MKSWQNVSRNEKAQILLLIQAHLKERKPAADKDTSTQALAVMARVQQKLTSLISFLIFMKACDLIYCCMVCLFQVNLYYSKGFSFIFI